MTSRAGDEILFDLEDLPLVSEYAWRVKPSTHHHVKYAHSGYHDGQTVHLKMHRHLLGVTDPKVTVDHINGDGLDNRRANLRQATRSQQAQNRRSWGRHSKFRGVTYDKQAKRFRAQLQVRGEIVFRCDARDEIVAALLYDHHSRIHHGDFGRRNFEDDTAIPPEYIPVLEDIRAGRASRYATVFKC
jgi:hypothetical protein